MKRIFAVVLAVAAIGSASAETSVGVSIGIHQPGVYGRIDIGDMPRPALVYAQPVIIAAPPVMYERRPIYLYVPPAHQANWGRNCSRYGACGQPVYFVQESWVRDQYHREHDQRKAPKAYKQKNDKKHDKGRGKGHDKHGD